MDISTFFSGEKSLFESDIVKGIAIGSISAIVLGYLYESKPSEAIEKTSQKVTEIYNELTIKKILGITFTLSALTLGSKAVPLTEKFFSVWGDYVLKRYSKFLFPDQ